MDNAVLDNFAAQILEKGKSNSLNDLLMQGASAPKNSTGKKRPYAQVESKVKSYIDSLPPPNARGKKTFKKHTSMPSYFGEGSTEMNASQLEQTFLSYKRQSEHTISELQQQVNVAVRLIGEANEEKYQLLDRIEHMMREKQTPVCTPSDPRPFSLAGLNRGDDLRTTGSFMDFHDPDPIPFNPPPEPIDQVVVDELAAVADMSLKTKRNLSFNSSSELTRSGGGTDSGINTSDGNDHMPDAGGYTTLPEPAQAVERAEGPREKKRRRKRKLWRYMTVFCCRMPATEGPGGHVMNVSYRKLGGN